MFEALAKLIRSCQRIRAAARFALLAYLAVVFGAGAALRNVHIESSEHGHRYCPEHEQIEAIEHADGAAAQDAHAGRGDSADASIPAVRSDEDTALRVHVACALLNALSNRAPVDPSRQVVFSETPDASCVVVTRGEGFDPFESVLSLAPKTSPPPFAS